MKVISSLSIPCAVVKTDPAFYYSSITPLNCIPRLPSFRLTQTKKQFIGLS